MASENLGFLKELYDLYVENPPKAIQRLVDRSCESVQWCTNADESMTGLRFAKDRDSKAAVAEYFEDVLRDWEPQGIEIYHFTEQDDRIYVSGKGTWKNRGTGNIVSTRKVDFFRFEDGEIVEFREFFDTASVMNAARTDC